MPDEKFPFSHKNKNKIKNEKYIRKQKKKKPYQAMLHQKYTRDNEKDGDEDYASYWKLPSTGSQYVDESEANDREAKQQPTTIIDAAAMTSSKWYVDARRFPPGFTPGPNDVICARGNHAWNNPGNRYFRKLVEKAAKAYGDVDSKIERSIIVTEIVEMVRSRGNGFVKATSDGRWMEVGDGLAREKAGQLLRNFLAKSYKSSVRAKSSRRKPLHLRLHNMVLSQPTINNHFNELNEKISKKGEEREEELTDSDLLDLLNRHNANILQAIREDTDLVKSFRSLDIGTERGQKQSPSTKGTATFTATPTHTPTHHVAVAAAADVVVPTSTSTTATATRADTSAAHDPLSASSNPSSDGRSRKRSAPSSSSATCIATSSSMAGAVSSSSSSSSSQKKRATSPSPLPSPRFS